MNNIHNAKPINVTEEGYGEYLFEDSALQNVNPETTHKEELQPTTIQPEQQAIQFSVHAESARSRRFSKINMYLAVGTTAVVAVGVAGNVAINKFKDVAEGFAPTTKETFDIDTFRQEVATVSSVANGPIESRADVHSSHEFLLADAECDTTVEGSQPFTMTPLADASNMIYDKATNRITIDLQQNPIELGEQHIEMGPPSDCTANNIGSHFGDDDKAYALAAKKAPNELGKRTYIQSAEELVALNDGEVGMDIAESAASTYQAIAGTILDIANSKVTLRYKYGDTVVFPNRENSTEVQLDAGNIEASN